jgi:hypothetical protein
MGKKVTIDEQEVDVKDWGEFWALVKEAKGHVTLVDDYATIDVTREKKVMIQVRKVWYKAYLEYYIDRNADDVFSDIFKILSDVEVETPYWSSIQVHKRDGIYYVIVTYAIDEDVEFVVHYVGLAEGLDTSNISSLTKPVDKIVKDLKRYFERW